MDREPSPAPRRREVTPDFAATAGPPSATAEVPIASSALLNGRSCVAIDHEGTRYLLRATRAGKLILTK